MNERKYIMRAFFSLLTLTALNLPESINAAPEAKKPVCSNPIYSEPYVSPYFTNPDDSRLQGVLDNRKRWGQVTDVCIEESDGYFATRSEPPRIGDYVKIILGDGTAYNLCTVDIQSSAHEVNECDGYRGDMTLKNGKSINDRNRFGVVIILQGRDLAENTTSSGTIPEKSDEPIRTPEIVPALPSSASPDELDESDDTDTFPEGVVGEECRIEIENEEERSGQQVCKPIFAEGTFYVDPGKLNPDISP